MLILPADSHWGLISLQLFANEWVMKWWATLTGPPWRIRDFWPDLVALERKRCLFTWQLNSWMCVSGSVCLCVSTYRKSKADKSLSACVNERVHMCDRVQQRLRLAACVWTLRASFISLTSDTAEALLVMMWLLLPIMPHCSQGRKTVRILPLSPRPAICCSSWTFQLTGFLHKITPQLDVWVQHDTLSTVNTCLLLCVVVDDVFNALINRW